MVIFDSLSENCAYDTPFRFDNVTPEIWFDSVESCEANDDTIELDSVESDAVDTPPRLASVMTLLKVVHVSSLFLT